MTIMERSTNVPLDNHVDTIGWTDDVSGDCTTYTRTIASYPVDP